MKPILSQKVARGAVVNEWEPAEHHLTVDGVQAFAARQKARIEAAAKARRDGIQKVAPITQLKGKKL